MNSSNFVTGVNISDPSVIISTGLSSTRLLMTWAMFLIPLGNIGTDAGLNSIILNLLICLLFFAYSENNSIIFSLLIFFPLICFI